MVQAPVELVRPVVVVQTPVEIVRPVARVVGLALTGAAVAGVAAALYRWYARERIPEGLAVLVALGVVGLYLNTSDALRAAMGGQRGVFDLVVVVVNTLTFAGAALAAPAAVRAGDRFVAGVAAVSGARELDRDVGELVRAVGRVVTVTLPEEIADMPAYDPVPAETKAELAGKTLVFPRRLTVGELHDRVVRRLKDDHGVGHVDLELADDGSVEYLAVGSRAAGLGPTLPPRTVAVPIRADPAFAASPGDLVQVWHPDGPERVLTGELRGIAGDVVTLAVDEADAERLEETTRYRLATLPAAPRPEQEFAALLRAADETMGVVQVEAGSDLAGLPLGSLAGTPIAVRPADGSIEALPARTRVLAPGDAVYVIARPEVLRRIGAAAGEAESSL